ncbi:MAG TPA: hypothetical protein CFH82_07155 [Sulfurospirillum sp. UBA12182]|jgi:hypothetical protein|nr:MAG TPA: hypothetical protein CFH82_07155 [Sulfurospirillum sp. UBA12182]
MAIGPIGAHIYVNQNMQVQASKQTDFQNRLEMQNLQAAAVANEKNKEVTEVRPTEETYKIDPENEHEKQKREEESGAKEEETTKDTKHKHLKESDEEEPPAIGHLDIKV